MKKAKKTVLLLLCAVVVCTAGCGKIVSSQQSECDKNGHDWKEATCTEPKTCKECDKTKGESLGHTFVDATCTAPKTCSVCNLTEGEPLAHTLSEATCIAPASCSVCGYTEGSPLDHSYTETVNKEPTCREAGEKLFTCSLCNDSYTEELTLEKFDGTAVHAAIKPSICEITSYNKNGAALGLGSGFVYEANGKLITNYHVIDGAYSITVNLNGQDYDVDYILAYDKNIDLAALQIDAEGLTPLTLCELDPPVGKPVFAMGSSRGMTNTFSSGTVTNDIHEEDGVEYVQHDAAISSGNSGGPLVNEYCEVIGVNTLALKDAQNMNFAVSVREIGNLDFSKKMTPAKFYEAECDPFDVLKTALIDEGEYDKKYNTYDFQIDEYYSDDLLYDTSLSYDADDDTIDWEISVTNGEYLILCWIEIDDASGLYYWYYGDTESRTIVGILEADSFNGANLGYFKQTFDNSEVFSTALNISNQLLDMLLSQIDDTLSPLGLEAEDFGFNKY